MASSVNDEKLARVRGLSLVALYDDNEEHKLLDFFVPFDPKSKRLS